MKFILRNLLLSQKEITNEINSDEKKELINLTSNFLKQQIKSNDYGLSDISLSTFLICKLTDFSNNLLYIKSLEQEQKAKIRYFANNCNIPNVDILNIILNKTLDLTIKQTNDDFEWVTILTPNDGAVNARERKDEPLSFWQRWRAKRYVRSNYPNATIIENPTGKYNCHSYAWHNQSNSNNIWIGAYDITYELYGSWHCSGENLHEYWNDGSYCQTNLTYSGIKVSYGTCGGDDHSAIRSSNNKVISKWGKGCLVKHNIDYCPYNSDNIINYIVPEVNGSNSICSSNSTYSLGSCMSNLSISWTKSNNLIYVSGQGTNNYTVRENTNSNNESGWIQAYLNGAYYRKDVFVGSGGNINGSTIIPYLKTGRWTVNTSCGSSPYNYDWFLQKEGSGSGAILIASTTRNELILKSVMEHKQGNSQNLTKSMEKQPNEYTIFHLYARVSDTDNYVFTTSSKRIVANGIVDLVPWLMPKNKNDKSSDVLETEYVKLFPNPASNNLTIKIVSENSNIENVEVLLFDRYMKKQKYKKAFGNELSLNVSNLPKGIYFLQIKYNDKIFFEKVMIE